MADYDRQYIKKQIASIVPATPTAGSLQDILSKAAGGNTFDKATDSLEMLSDKVGAYAGTSGAGATESIKAELDLVKAKTDLITAGAVSVAGVSATTTGVIVQDGATGTPNIVEITPNATSNTFSAWTEIDASVAADAWICNIAVYGNATGTGGKYCLEIGTGNSASEAAKVRFSFETNLTGGSELSMPFIFSLPIPIKVPSGTRIAARCSHTGASGTKISVGISYYTTLES